MHMFLVSACFLVQYLLPSSSWMQCVEGPLTWTSKSQSFGEGGWLGEALGENAEMKPGCFHLISLYCISWRWQSLERCECGNMESFSQNKDLRKVGLYL